MRNSRHGWSGGYWNGGGDSSDGIPQHEDMPQKGAPRHASGGSGRLHQKHSSVSLDEVGGIRHRRTTSYGSLNSGSQTITIPQPRSLQKQQQQQQVTPLGSFDFKVQLGGSSVLGGGKLLVPQGDAAAQDDDQLFSPPTFPELLSLNELQHSAVTTATVQLPPPPRTYHSRRCKRNVGHGTSGHPQAPLLLDEGTSSELLHREDSSEELRRLAPLLERAISSIMLAASQDSKLMRSPTPGLAFSSSSSSAPPNSANPRTGTVQQPAATSILTTRSVHDLINDLVSKIDYGGYAAIVFTAAVAYLARIPTTCPCASTPSKLLQCVCARCAITESNWYRFTLVAILVATKMHAERSCRTRANERFACATGVSLTELRQLEVEFLYLIDFSLMITQEVYQLWSQWVNQLGQLQSSPAARQGLASPPAGCATPACCDGSASSSLTTFPPTRLFSVMNGTEPDVWQLDDIDELESNRPPTPPARDATPPSFFRRPPSDSAQRHVRAKSDEDDDVIPDRSEHAKAAGDHQPSTNAPVGLWGRFRQRLQQTPPQSPLLATMQRLPLQLFGAARTVMACMSRRSSNCGVDEDDKSDRPQLARILLSHSPPM